MSAQVTSRPRLLIASFCGLALLALPFALPWLVPSTAGAVAPAAVRAAVAGK